MSVLYNPSIKSLKNFSGYQKCFRLRWWSGLHCFDFTEGEFSLTGYEKSCFRKNISILIYRFTMVKQD